MAIKIVCPRCRKPLSVPSKIAGAYANCPSCSGRFWVPENVPAEGKSGDPLLKNAPAEGKPGDLPAEPSTARPGNSAPPRTPPLAPAASQSSPWSDSPNLPATAPNPPGRGVSGRQVVPSPPLPSVPERKVARFITSEAAQSTLKLAEDGHLPELRLRESQGEEKAVAKTTTVNPLVLLCALSISVVFSISLALIDFGGDPNADSPRQLRARQLIERDYLPMDKDEPLLSYQRYLGAAQRAHSQGNVKLERALYRRVLDMLREERGDFQKGLTGSRDRDEKLKTWISILLREG